MTSISAPDSNIFIAEGFSYLFFKQNIVFYSYLEFKLDSPVHYSDSLITI